MKFAINNAIENLSRLKYLMKGDLRALFVELICMLLNTSTSDKNFIQTTAKELSFGIISDIISNNCQMIVKFDEYQSLVKYEMSAVFCSDSDDLNLGDQVICLKNGHWKVIPVKHWDKLSNTGFGYRYFFFSTFLVYILNWKRKLSFKTVFFPKLDFCLNLHFWK